MPQQNNYDYKAESECVLFYFHIIKIIIHNSF
jgi:hypothetical protein